MAIDRSFFEIVSHCYSYFLFLLHLFNIFSCFGFFEQIFQIIFISVRCESGGDDFNTQCGFMVFFVVVVVVVCSVCCCSWYKSECKSNLCLVRSKKILILFLHSKKKNFFFVFVAYIDIHTYKHFAWNILQN